ncbi:MAG: hypothetical protein HY936_04420 [Nitrosomonadales bacterium]|nr:hypothetical protein [Nitrosomonadales bacterium]
MKICRFIYLSLVIALSSANYAYARSDMPCSGKNETLECLKENFSDIYDDQYYKFLMIIGKAQVAALNCNSNEKTAAYLGIVSKIGDNLEVEYGFKDTLETRFLKEKTVCLLDAILLSDDNVKEIILGKYLAKPRYIKKKEVDAILSRYMEQEKYKEMLKRYSGK